MAITAGVALGCPSKEEPPPPVGDPPVTASGAPSAQPSPAVKSAPSGSAPAVATAVAPSSAPPPRPAPTSPEQSRDPPGMRGFFFPRGKLPKVSPPKYASAEAPCPVDMVHVKGLRCGVPKQRCKKFINPPGKRKVSCEEFVKPSVCEGHERNMEFCVDRYEFTPEGYDYPLTHVNWTEAQLLCVKMGKRLCSESEWEFACEGPEALPYPYGYVRDAKRCNHDIPEIDLVTRPDHFIDHRKKKDELPGCKSPFGVYNIVGNVDEWTTRTASKRGQRAILRGGWWLMGRNRCRAATANHGEVYAGMQTGFRCCKAAR